MDRPKILYAIYDATECEVVKSRWGMAYINPMDATRDMKRLEILYPNKKFELLMYERF